MIFGKKYAIIEEEIRNPLNRVDRFRIHDAEIISVGPKWKLMLELFEWVKSAPHYACHLRSNVMIIKEEAVIFWFFPQVCTRRKIVLVGGLNDHR